MEFAIVKVTNIGTATCTVSGYPGVSLYLAGVQVGTVAGRSNLPYSTLPLAPGSSATAKITDHSDCNAPLSDSVRIYPPNNSAYVDVATQLRACPLVVDPFMAA